MASVPPPPNSEKRRVVRERLANNRIARVFRYPDFRLLWIGAFLSFTGGWVQNVAQGYFVYQLTHDESKLALVNFAWSMPVALFGLVSGTLADTFNKRTVLVVTHLTYACLSLYLAIATYQGFIQYWMIPAVALVLGSIASVEMPTRQSIVSRVVPPEDLAAAVPVNAMTFNVARILGPAIGGILLARFGVPACYMLNAVSFLAVVWAAIKMRTDLSAREREPQPIRDLLMEGLLYTFRDHRLRALLLLETITAAIGIAYIPQLPAIVEQVLQPSLHTPPGVDPEIFAKQWLGYAYTAIGIGAVCALIVVTQLADSKRKGTIIRVAMWTLAIGLPILSVSHSPYVVFPLLGILGMAGVSQFNTTNSLFQLLAPERLRGRVLAMHIWALNGLSPFGVLFFGWLANSTRVDRQFDIGPWSIHTPLGGVPLSLEFAGAVMLVGAIAATLSKRGLSNLEPHPDNLR
ncbi:MAG: MFS transporter [Fimbriimonas sp.]